MLKLLATVVALALAAAAPAATVYSNNFDGGVSTAGGVTAVFSGYQVTGTTVLNGYGFSGSFLRNDSVLQGGTPNRAQSTILTLSGLGAHTSVSLGMVYAFLDSWDSTNGSVSPDLVDMVIDGTTRISGLTYGTASGSNVYYGGGTLLGAGIQLDNTSNGYSDAVIDLNGSPNLTFAHSASTLTLEIFAYGAGWQGGTDESWGIDNLTIGINGTPSTTDVPEPATWAMMVGGFGLLGAALRRMRQTGVGFA